LRVGLVWSPAASHDEAFLAVPHETLIIGVDLGTSGVRALAAGATGHVLARAAMALPASAIVRDANRHEQSPRDWRQAVCQATHALMDQLAAAGASESRLAGLAVDGTSGTVVAVDSTGAALRPALMYNDPRAGAESRQLGELAADAGDRLPAGLDASFALPKIEWLRRHEPKTFGKTARFLHQADYITGLLTGDFGVTDYSNALKTGYDVFEQRWPLWLAQLPGLLERLPRVVPPATRVGCVCRDAAAQTGLPEGLPVLAGATDGTAACLASGLRRAGDYNTTLGTTLVFKGLSRRPVRDAAVGVYSHKLPGGWWLPGAASNTGGEWIGAWFADADPAQLDEAAGPLLPGGLVCYPLVRRGERFPFVRPQAEGFCLPEPADMHQRYAAGLVGTALVERLAYQVLDGSLGVAHGEIYSTGGGSGSDIWMQCRADATGRTLHRPSAPESAFGSAILAAAGTVHGDLDAAIASMVRVERSFSPNREIAQQYTELFQRFCDELRRRGYL
jgi:D-ribulokinase